MLDQLCIWLYDADETAKIVFTLVRVSKGMRHLVHSSGLKRLSEEARRRAEVEKWEEQQKRASGMEHVRLWDKMMLEDERVAGIKIEFLQSLAGELIAKNLAADAKIACRDATIRELRACARKRKN